MLEEELRKIIRAKINFKEIEHKDDETNLLIGADVEYDGFDMSGYNKSHYRNLEILSRFKNYMLPKKAQHGDYRDGSCIIPMFWKGLAHLIKFNTHCGDNKGECIKDVEGGSTTEDIIFEIITTENPDILKTIEDQLKEAEEAFNSIKNKFEYLRNKVEVLSSKIVKDSFDLGIVNAEKRKGGFLTTMEFHIDKVIGDVELCWSNLLDDYRDLMVASPEDEYRKRKKREHKIWTKEDEKDLIDMYNNKKNLVNISKKLKRTTSAIMVRLNKLGLLKGRIRTNIKKRVCQDCMRSLKFRELSW